MREGGTPSQEGDHITLLGQPTTMTAGEEDLHRSFMQRLSHRGFVCVATVVIILAAVCVLDVKNIVMLMVMLPGPAAILYWLWFRSDRHTVSADLVVKVFAFGFLPGSILVMIVEIVIVIIVFLLCFSGKFSELAALLPSSHSNTTAPLLPSESTPAPLMEEEVRDLLMTFVRGSLVRVVIFMFLMAYVVAAGVEESMKYCIPVSFRRVRIHTNPKIYIIAAVAATLGFSTMENVGYVCFGARKMPFASQLLEAVGRAALATPLHAICGGMIGVRLTRRHVLGENGMYVVLVMFPSVLLHGTFDFFQFVLMIAEVDDTIASVIVLIGSIALLAAGAAYLRWSYKSLQLPRLLRSIGEEMA